MLTDREKYSSCKSLRSSSLVSSLFESATSIIHPLERLEPTNVEVQIDSPKATPVHPSTSESIQLTHFGRSGLNSFNLNDRKASSGIGGIVSGLVQQHERWENNIFPIHVVLRDSIRAPYVDQLTRNP